MRAMRLWVVVGFSDLCKTNICKKEELPVKSPILLFTSLICLQYFGVCSGPAQAPATNSTQPLNSTVSDFGTSFTFSPPPICPKCVETELGFLSLSANDGRSKEHTSELQSLR